MWKQYITIFHTTSTIIFCIINTVKRDKCKTKVLAQVECTTVAVSKVNHPYLVRNIAKSMTSFSENKTTPSKISTKSPLTAVSRLTLPSFLDVSNVQQRRASKDPSAEVKTRRLQHSTVDSYLALFRT